MSKLIDVIETATYNILFEYAVRSGDTFRQWLYPKLPKSCNYNHELPDLISKGIVQGKSAQQIADEIYRNHSQGRSDEMIQIKIRGRRWFQKAYGNTYHSVRVYVNQGNGFELIGEVRFAYGYGDQYIDTALRILQEKGFWPNTGERLKSGIGKDYYDFMEDRRNNRDKYDIEVVDVSRKKDL